MSAKQILGVIEHLLERFLFIRSDRFLFAASPRQRNAKEKCLSLLRKRIAGGKEYWQWVSSILQRRIYPSADGPIGGLKPPLRQFDRLLFRGYENRGESGRLAVGLNQA